MNFPDAATIPIIAFSADCKKPEYEWRDIYFTECLHKPFTVSQLLDIIEKHTPFKRKPEEIDSGKDKYGWKAIMGFTADDPESAIKILDSFIEETTKDREFLKIAFQKGDNGAIRQVFHKMSTLMRMISAKEIVSIFADFDKGEISKEKEATLFRLLDETIKEAKDKRLTINN
jgi:HPt (histidine-containing phosphotransfer) domain-containing protein